MSAVALTKAWNTILKNLSEDYEELDEGFMKRIRSEVEKAYTPLFATDANGVVGGGKKAKKPRGVTAFNVFVQDFNEKHKGDAPTKDPTDPEGKKDLTLFKLASVEWKNVDAATRQTFQDKATAANKEKGIVPAADRKKKAVNRYNVFVQEYKEAHPDQEGGRNLFKEAAAEWKLKTKEQKAAYKVKADALNVQNGNDKAANAANAKVVVDEAPAVAEVAVAEKPAKTKAAKEVKATETVVETTKAAKAAKAPKVAKGTTTKAVTTADKKSPTKKAVKA